MLEGRGFSTGGQMSNVKTCFKSFEVVIELAREDWWLVVFMLVEGVCPHTLFDQC